MQKLIVLGIIVMMITGCSVAANAYAGVSLNITPLSDNGSFHTVAVGWMTSTQLIGIGSPTTDGLDVGWDAADSLTPPAGTIEMDIVNNVIGGSKVQLDYRAPLLPKPDFKIWRLKTVVANPDPVGAMIGGTLGLDAEFQTGYVVPVGTAFYIFNANYTTQAQCTAAIGGANQIVKLTSSNASFSNATNSYTLAAPVYDADADSWSTPNKYFTVYAEMVPEPGSLLAMFSGIIGLVGFGLRRKR